MLWLLCRLVAGRPFASVDPPTDAAERRATPWRHPAIDYRHEDGTTATPLPASAFYACRRERAARRQPPNKHDLTIWAARNASSTEGLLLERDDAEGRAPQRQQQRHEVPGVPGAFVISSVLTRGECAALLATATALGYERDEPLDAAARSAAALAGTATAGGFASLLDDDDDSDAESDDDNNNDTKRAQSVVRSEHREPVVAETAAASSSSRAGERSRAVVWCVGEALHDAVFERCRAHLPQRCERCADARGRDRGPGTLAGLNRRWRFYRYDAGGTYRPHLDGAWPGSSLRGPDTSSGEEDAEYVYDAFGDRLSRLTLLVYLNAEFDGGCTAFYSAEDDGALRVDAVEPRAGSVLLFPHGDALGSLVHEGATVTAGSKYVIRTEVLYKWDCRFRDDPPGAAAADRRPSPTSPPFERVEEEASSRGEHVVPKETKAEDFVSVGGSAAVPMTTTKKRSKKNKRRRF